MAIRTEDCVKKIVEHFAGLADPKIWKRVSKTKTLEGFIARRFECKTVAGISVIVIADENKLLELRVFAASEKPVAPSDTVGGLIAKCKQILMDADDDVNVSTLVYGLEFATLPQIGGSEDTDFDTGELEDVDFENLELYDITDTTIRLSAGGDWQDPVEFTASLKSDGKLYYNEDAKKSDHYDGMTTKQLIKNLFGTTNPPELEGKDISDY